MLNMCGESGHPCLIPDPQENTFSFCLLSIMLLAVRLSYMAFVMLRYVPSIYILLSVFIINGCCALSNAFSAYDHVIFVFPFVYVMYYVY